MKYLATLLSLFLFLATAQAQNTVPRTPLFEVFTSSTCGPCNPANAYQIPIYDQFKEDVLVVKYQMSWPGNGDPYFTNEAAGRRSTYSINSVPALIQNGTQTGVYDIDGAKISSMLDSTSEMKMELRYLIDAANRSIRIRARVEALNDFTVGAQRWFIPIYENITYNNIKTNGETVFYHVFKKMLPEGTGQFIIGNLDAGTVLEFDSTYVFQGGYRLPSSSNDPINHQNEHSVEDFNQLGVGMFMQALNAEKEIYNAAVGEQCFTVENLEREWGTPPTNTSVNELSESGFFGVYPNPANESLTLDLTEVSSLQEAVLYNTMGQIVWSKPLAGEQQFIVDVSGFTKGLYVLRLSGNEKSFEKKVIIQ